MSDVIRILEEIRAHSGKPSTAGLPDAVVERFAEQDPSLIRAVEMAREAFKQLKTEFPDLIKRDEADQAAEIQAGFVNFYPDDAINPYVTLAASGPWPGRWFMTTGVTGCSAWAMRRRTCWKR